LVVFHCYHIFIFIFVHQLTTTKLQTIQSDKKKKQILDGLFLSGSEDKSIKLWSVDDSKCLGTWQQHSEGVWTLQELSKGLVASGSWDGTIKIWEFSFKAIASNIYYSRKNEALTNKADPTGTSTVTAPTSATPAAATSSLSSPFLLSCGKCVQTLSGHNGCVRGIVYVRENREKKEKIIASCAADKTMKLWNVTTGACLLTVTAHQAGITALLRLKNGSIATGSRDKTVKVWNKTGDCIASFETSGEVWCLREFKDGSVCCGLSGSAVERWKINFDKTTQQKDPSASKAQVTPGSHSYSALVASTSEPILSTTERPRVGSAPIPRK